MKFNSTIRFFSIAAAAGLAAAFACSSDETATSTGGSAAGSVDSSAGGAAGAGAPSEGGDAGNAGASDQPSGADADPASVSRPVPEVVAKARTEAATTPITVTALRGNVSVLAGSGGNIAVLAGSDGLLMVDAGFVTSRPQMLQALASVSASASGSAPPALLDVRVARVINTHWHADHTDGNEYLHAIGAVITAHSNSLERLSTTQTGEIMDGSTTMFPPALAGGLPTDVISKKKTIHFDGQTVVIEHYAPAHTDTDLAVTFKEADILTAGDTWFNGIYPFIDIAAGGSIDGMINATKANIAAVTGDTMIIPGHGPVGHRADLVDTLDMLTTVRDKIAALKASGMTLEQTISAKPTAMFDERYGKGPLKPDIFVSLIYRSL